MASLHEECSTCFSRDWYLRPVRYRYLKKRVTSREWASTHWPTRFSKHIRDFHFSLFVYFVEETFGFRRSHAYLLIFFAVIKSWRWLSRIGYHYRWRDSRRNALVPIFNISVKSASHFRLALFTCSISRLCILAEWCTRSSTFLNAAET